MNEFYINQKLPSLNDYINTCRRNPYQANKYKQDLQRKIGIDIHNARKNGTLQPINEPCEVYCIWQEKNKRRDVDNVQSAIKFILDALVECEILPNDSPKYVKQIHHIVKYGKENCIKVEIRTENENERIEQKTHITNYEKANSKRSG